jgi:hypothetical protein
VLKRWLLLELTKDLVIIEVEIDCIKLLRLFLKQIGSFGVEKTRVNVNSIWTIGSTKLFVFVLAYSLAGWDELEPGKYEFPFALKVKRKRQVALKHKGAHYKKKVSKCKLSSFDGRT